MITYRRFSVFMILLVSVMYCTGTAQTTAVCGDANGDGELNVGDAVFMINFVFRGGPGPDSTCFYECSNGEQGPCYTGPPGTEGVGVCQAGQRLCVEGFWSEWCVGQIIPSTEICDGLDNDCDDIPDNNLTPIPCDLTEGVCAGAVRVCGGEAGWLPCDASSYGPDYQLVEMRCDGLDNDCNGVEDDMCLGAPHVEMWSCEADTCIITACETGYADNNGTYNDGCEAPAAGYCLINGTLYGNGEYKPSSVCEYCDASANQYNWTLEVCDDDNICTSDACDPMSGCTFTPNSSPCDLPHANGICSGGECTVGSCDSKWANCDGIESNGCELDLSYTTLSWSTPYTVGTFDGDECSGCGTSYYMNGRGSDWLLFHMNECCGAVGDLHDVGIRATLTSPSGMDYDLYLWDGHVHTVLDSSNNDAGQDDYVEYCPNDNLFGDDSYDYIIEVRTYGGSSCEDWTLHIESCP